MEFPELVHACSLRGCGQKNDFLPFTCDGCAKKFCLEHHRHENHGCHVKPRDDKYVPVCPLCMQAISVKPGDNVNNKVDEHIRAGCPDAVVKSRKNGCTQKGCREKEFVPISCKLCRQTFCMKHRFESDHDCPAKKSGSANAAAAKVTASAAAAAAATRQRQHQQQQQQQQHRQQQQQQARPSSAASAARDASSSAANAARGASDSLSQAAAGAWSAATTSPFSPFQGMTNSQFAAQRGGAGPAGGGGGGAERKKLKHSNKAEAAIGSQGIPESERMLLSLYFPVTTNRPPEFHVVSVRWCVEECVWVCV